MIAVTRIDRDRLKSTVPPTALPAPKYLRAALSVSTTVSGAASAVAASLPASVLMPSTGRIAGSPQ